MALTILSAIVGAIVGFAVAGFGAAMLLVSIFGHQDGGTDMGGFFGFGPIGGVAGALLGAGLALRFRNRSPNWGKGLLIGATVVAAGGGALLAFVSLPDRGLSYSEVIQFELAYPSASLVAIEIPSEKAMWGAAGGDAPGDPISQFFDKKCDGGVCVLNGSVAALGPTENFRISVSLAGKKTQYQLDLPARISDVIDWSAWTQGEEARFRWRVVKR